MSRFGANRLFGLVPIVLLFLSAPVWTQDRDPFQKGTVAIEFGAAPLFEIWNLNEYREEMLETTASFWGAVHNRVALGLEFHHVWVFQRVPGAFVQGLSPLVRVKLTGKPKWNWYVETGPGVSWSDLEPPYRGTKVNYLFQGGSGLMRRTSAHSHLRIAYRFFHLSNHRRAGKDHNPDFEMMGPFASWSLSF
jgi:hypothetical protein